MKRVVQSLILFPLLFVCGCGSMGTYHYDNANLFTEFSGQLEFGKEDSTFKSLTVYWVSGEVNVIEGESFSVRETNLKQTEYLPLYYYIDKDAVSIEYCKSDTPNSKIKDGAKRLEITIPASLDEMKFNLVSADYKVDAKDIESLSAGVTSGNGKVSLASAKTIKSKSVSGNLTLQLKDVAPLSKIEIDSVSGNSELYLDSSRGYSLSFDSVSGKLNERIELDEGDSSPKYDIDFDSVSGNLLIDNYKA